MISTQITQLLTTTEQGNIGDGLGKNSAIVERLAQLAIPKFGVSPNININGFQSNEHYDRRTSISILARKGNIDPI